LRVHVHIHINPFVPLLLSAFGRLIFNHYYYIDCRLPQRVVKLLIRLRIMGEERTDFISYIIILVEEIEKFLKTQQDFFIFLYKIIL